MSVVPPSRHGVMWWIWHRFAGASQVSRHGARCLAYRRVRFPMPLSEPDVRLSPHPALHGSCCQAVFIEDGQGEGIDHR